ncbi:PepSY domain-containing protein [Sphingomonas oleivorans]|uniref:PepSY domain-containing protein n=1 Tax=Sphingomonas oleivorans TaxID=1735121 RepID=UPI001FAFCD2E|nr:PepSY domain-containing protein [Sphingomonas oleivorans]
MRSRRARLHVGASRVHKWLALVIGAQLLLWFTSGLVMSLLPIERVRGEHLVRREQAASLPDALLPSLLDRPDVRALGPVKAVTFRMLLDRPVAELTLMDDRVRLLDAASGRPLPALDARNAEAIARSAYVGSPPSARVERVLDPITEYKGRLPAWRVMFEDREATRVYVDAATGRIGAVRTGTWRLYDFFWALHIMDWKNHEDFNTPWLLAFAAGGLLLALAGAVLLFMRWPRRRRRAIG